MIYVYEIYYKSYGCNIKETGSSCLCKLEVAVSCGKHRSARICTFSTSLPLLNLHVCRSSCSLVWLINSRYVVNPYRKTTNIFCVVPDNVDLIFHQNTSNMLLRCAAFDFLFQFRVHIILPSRKFPTATSLL